MGPTSYTYHVIVRCNFTSDSLMVALIVENVFEAERFRGLAAWDRI